MNKPLVFQKNAEKLKNKMVIPKFFINKYGYQYYMTVYNDKIVIEPMNKKKKEVKND